MGNFSPLSIFRSITHLTMKKVLVLIAISFFYWLGCTKNPPIDTTKTCVRTFDTMTTLDNYIEMDSLSPFKGQTTLNLTLRIVRIATQSGTCEVMPLCNNFMTITNRTEKTIAIFYNTVGGINATIRPYETKYEVVPSGAILGITGSCFNFMEFKNSIKVRYY